MSSPPSSNIAPETPFSRAITNTLKLRFMKFLIYLLRYFEKSAFPPTLTKRLHPSLPTARIFLPPSTTSSSPPLPTLFDIHGGGYCFGSPPDDDHINTNLAASGILVISLPYPLAPGSAYPSALAALATQINNAIADPDLPIDVSRLGLLGFSAGGNLALAVQQVEGMPEIKITVAFYPPVDFTRTIESRLSTRVPRARKEEDWLTALVPLFVWGYIPSGTLLSDPKLSPIYASRKVLTEWIFVVGCDRDMLCTEAGEMVAEWLDEEWGVEGKDVMEGEEGKVRWYRVNGQKHAYTHDLPGVTAGETAELREVRKRKDREVWEMVSQWLMEGPFKK